MVLRPSWGQGSLHMYHADVATHCSKSRNDTCICCCYCAITLCRWTKLIALLPGRCINTAYTAASQTVHSCESAYRPLCTVHTLTTCSYQYKTREDGERHCHYLFAAWSGGRVEAAAHSIRGQGMARCSTHYTWLGWCTVHSKISSVRLCAKLSFHTFICNIKSVHT